MKDKLKTKSVQVRITEHQHNQLKEIVSGSTTTINTYVRNAISQKLLADQKQLKEKGWIKL